MKWYNATEVKNMKLKKLRLEKGLTQEKASQLLGVSRRTYVTYEKDEGKIPPIKIGKKFLKTVPLDAKLTLIEILDVPQELITW